MPDIPVVVLGAGGVGKSCLTIQYIQGHFVDKYDATIEDVYRKPVDIDGQPAVLTVVDTAGQEAFGVMRDQYLRKGQGFVLVYSITDQESFLQVQKIYAQLRRIRGTAKPSPCVLVANKIDQEAYRAVERESGRQLAADMMSCPFLEVTAKSHKMAEEVFEILVRTIRNDASTPGGADSSSSLHANAARGSDVREPPWASAADGRAGQTVSTTGEASGASRAPARGKAKKTKRCTLL